jgi:hypothetical protein
MAREKKVGPGPRDIIYTPEITPRLTMQSINARKSKEPNRYALLKLSSISSKTDPSGLRDLPHDEAVRRLRRRRSIPAHTAIPSTQTNTTKPMPRLQTRPSILPRETIRAASNECHDDAPKWWKRGVTTSPFSRCRKGNSFGPVRIRRSDLFFWKVWMTL